MSNRLLALVHASFVAILFIVSTPVSAQTWDVDALMRLLAQQTGGHARFTETKTMAVLDKPVVSRGELVFSPPDRLEKNTLSPKPEALLVERDQVTMTRGGQTRRLRLTDYPEVLTIIEAVRGSLLGDRSRLERYYKLELGGTARQWRLTLTPTEARMQRWVSKIVVEGRSAQIDTIETQQADGDRSLMSITLPK